MFRIFLYEQEKVHIKMITVVKLIEFHMVGILSVKL